MFVKAITAAALALSVSSVAYAQAKEQFFPVLVYRTGAYAPNGVPWADGYVDYLKLVNSRDGGVERRQARRSRSARPATRPTAASSATSA